MNRTSKIMLRGALFTLLLSIQTVSAFYDPGLQRWINRDPAEELGFARIPHTKARRDQQAPGGYTFVGNNAVGRIDPDGLVSVCCRGVKADPGDPWYVKLCPVDALHCDLSVDYRSGKCPDGYKEYPATIGRPGCMDNGKKCSDVTLVDVLQCLRRNPYSARKGVPGSNCQTNTRDRLEKCCLSADWGPQYGADEPVSYVPRF